MAKAQGDFLMFIRGLGKRAWLEGYLAAVQEETMAIQPHRCDAGEAHVQPPHARINATCIMEGWGFMSHDISSKGHRAATK